MALLREEGFAHEASRLADRLLARLAEACRDFPESSRLHERFAWLAAALELELDSAVTAAERSVELAPERADYWATLAEVHFRRGDRDRAIGLLEKAIDLEPASASFQSQLEQYRGGQASMFPGVPE